ncbi:MAG: helix-hairpin-helix domain-containing protein [candidate division WOR-3 bacterium]
MKRVIPLLIVAAAAALAQTPNDVLAELNQTDQVIERVTPLVEQSGNVEAQMLLAEAKRVQAQAWNAYHGRRYRFALGQTRYARRKARDAAALVEISPERIREEIRLTAELMERVEHGVRAELLPLVRLEGVGRVRARILYNAGLRTIEDLRKASVENLMSLPYIGPKIAKKIKEQVGGTLTQEEWRKLTQAASRQEQQPLTEYYGKS